MLSSVAVVYCKAKVMIRAEGRERIQGISCAADLPTVINKKDKSERRRFFAQS